jgi:hypothetical protein
MPSFGAASAFSGSFISSREFLPLMVVLHKERRPQDDETVANRQHDQITLCLQPEVDAVFAVEIFTRLPIGSEQRVWQRTGTKA